MKKKAVYKYMGGPVGQGPLSDGQAKFAPCAGCPMPNKCKAVGKCLKGGK